MRHSCYFMKSLQFLSHVFAVHSDHAPHQNHSSVCKLQSAILKITVWFSICLVSSYLPIINIVIQTWKTIPVSDWTQPHWYVNPSCLPVHLNQKIGKLWRYASSYLSWTSTCWPWTKSCCLYYRQYFTLLQPQIPFALLYSICTQLLQRNKEQNVQKIISVTVFTKWNNVFWLLFNCIIKLDSLTMIMVLYLLSNNI